MITVHFKRIILFTAVLLATGTLSADANAEQKPQFLLKSKVLTSEKTLLTVQPTDKYGVIGDDEALRKLLGEWQANDDFGILSAPSIMAPLGQEAVIRVQSEIQYFERAKDGTFVLRTLRGDESAGVRLATTTKKTTDKGQITLDVDLQVNTLRDRQKLPGVSLDVGRPVMRTRTIKTQITIPLGQWVWVGGQQLQDVASGKREHLLILLKVSKADPK